MKQRLGEFSLPLKIIMLVVGGLIVLLLYITVSRDMLTGFQSPVSSFIDSTLSGGGAGG